MLLDSFLQNTALVHVCHQLVEKLSCLIISSNETLAQCMPDDSGPRAERT